MKRKKLLSVLLLTTVMGLAACGKEDSEPKETEVNDTKEESVTETANSDVEIEVFVTAPWVNIPASGDDFVADYLGDTYGGKWRMTLASDGMTELTTRMASGDAPDLIQFDNTIDLQKFYDQGVLIDDWTPYVDQMPTWMESMTEAQREYFTSTDGKLKAIAPAPGGQSWGFMIRQDWLDNLNLEMPTTAEELLDVMRAFTFDDPDGNGVDDTYGFTQAGTGGINELGKMLMLFDNPDIYIKDGKVTNALVEGTYKTYLDYAKTIVDEGLINPDWYTIGWEDRKPGLYQQMVYGICYYPPGSLLEETVSSRGVEGEEADAIADKWVVMDLCGGKGEPLPIQSSSGILSVSEECAADSAKMEILCKFFEDCGSFNESYANVRATLFKYPEGTKGYELKDGMMTFWEISDDEKKSLDEQTVAEYDEVKEFFQNEGNYGWQNWGKLINHSPSNLFFRASKEESHLSQRMQEMTGQIASRTEVWDNTYMMYTPDATLAADLKDKLDEYSIQYIMGEVSEDSYEDFVEEWRADGGQEYLDAAKEQFIELGVMQ